MIGIVIVAHGGLAKEYLSAMEHVVGKQPGVAAISIGRFRAAVAAAQQPDGQAQRQ